MYVSPFSYIENGDTKYRLQGIQRRLAGSDLETTITDRDIAVYLIAEGSSKDSGFKTSSIYIGDGSHGGFLSYDPYYGLTIKANRIEMVSGGTIGGNMVGLEEFNDYKDDMEQYKNTVQTRFTQVENQINLQVTEIKNNYVGNHEVLAKINLSTEGVRIAGKKIQIDGNTIFNSDTQFNGVISAGKKIIIEDTGAGKRTILSGGTIEFYEWSP